MPGARQSWPDTFTFRCQALLHPQQGASCPGCLVFHDGLVVSTEPRDAEGATIELPDALVIPGLANAHTHLEFSDIRTPLGHPGIPLPSWIPLVVGHRRSGMNSEGAGGQRSDAFRAGLAESLACGVTLIGDIVTTPWNANWMSQAANPGTAFLELLSLDPEMQSDLISQAQQHLNDQNGWLRGLSPHAPYSVHPDLLHAACQLSAAAKAPVAMHVAETQQELQLLASGDGPFQAMLEAFQVWRPDVFAEPREPLEILQCLELAQQALVIHGNYLNSRELQFLGQHRQKMTLVYCPRTHHFFGHEPYPLSEAIGAGVHLALGTDSRASNPDLDLWQDLQFAIEQHADVDPAHLLAAATLNGKRALGAAWPGWMGSSLHDLTLIEPAAPAGDVWQQLLGSSSQRFVDVVATGSDG